MCFIWYGLIGILQNTHPTVSNALRLCWIFPAISKKGSVMLYRQSLKKVLIKITRYARNLLWLSAKSPLINRPLTNCFNIRVAETDPNTNFGYLSGQIKYLILYKKYGIARYFAITDYLFFAAYSIVIRLCKTPFNSEISFVLSNDWFARSFLVM